MPTDAKCGLLVGVGLVVAAAILFFQKDPDAPALAIPPAEAGQVTLLPKPVEKAVPPALPVPAAHTPGRFVSRVSE